MGLAVRIGWTPSEFWRTSYHDLTVALAAWFSAHSPKDTAMNEDQLDAFFDTASALGIAEAHHA